MKRLISFILLLPVLAFGQGKVIAEKLIEPEYLTVVMDSVTQVKVYYIFPSPQGLTSSNRTAPSETAPTSASAQAINKQFSSTGDVFISVVLDTLTNSDTDSLYFSVKPLIYDETKATWYESVADVLYLVFDTASTYTSSSLDYLSWTHGYCYTTVLSGALWPCAGFTLMMDRVNRGNAYGNADITAYIGFWNVR